MKKTKKSKKTVAETTAANNSTETRKGSPGRPSGTGNYLTTVSEIVRLTGVDVPKDAMNELSKHRVPLIQSFIKAANLRSQETPFKTNKESIGDLVAKYIKKTSPAIKNVEVGSQSE